MSIYDDPANKDKRESAQKPPPNQLASPPPAAAVDGKVAAGEGKEAETPRRRGCGCGSCLLAFFFLGLVCVVFCGIGGYLGLQRAPGWTRDYIVTAVNQSEFDPQTKREITAEMDRLLDEYRAGNVSSERAVKALEELGKSPVLVLMMAYAAMEIYIDPSGLSDDEKAAAKLALQRIARGTFNQKIDQEDLEDALDYISEKDFNGNRKIKNRLTDEEIREFVKECVRVADEAEIPNEPYQVDVAAEVKRIVDRAIGIEPAETAEAENVAAEHAAAVPAESIDNADSPDEPSVDAVTPAAVER